MTRAPRQLRAIAVVSLAVAAGCTGDIGAGVAGGGTQDPPGSAPRQDRQPSNPGNTTVPDTTPLGAPPPPPAGLAAFAGGARALSPAEYDRTLRDLLDDQTGAGQELLPEPALSRELPFQNDAPSKLPSNVLIEALEQLAWDAADRAVARPEVLAKIVPCAPRAPDDRDCFQSFLTRFGRRVLRRPLEATELAAYQRFLPFAVEKKRFDEAVRLTIAALLQHPAFYHRLEVGTPVAGKPGLFRLGGYETATKLSYYLLGTTPDDKLLDLAASGGLTDGAAITAAARAMVADPRARDRVYDFHAEWLGFAQPGIDPALARPMIAETRALLDDVVFTRGAAYSDLFVTQKSFVDATLARHYGLPVPAQPGWVDVSPARRAGLLSHGTFLSAASKPDDTSPVNRGLLVAARFLCRHIPDPPPDVNASLPEDTRCRSEMLKMHMTRGSSCAACHAHIDPIGFGLEAYDRTGKFRTVEKDRPDCPIEGAGELPGVGPFRGPAELGRLVVGHEAFDACVARHVHQFASGRHEGGGDELFSRMGAEWKRGGHRFTDLLVAIAADPGFVHRRE